MDLEKLTKKLLDKKADENNTIDLNAYAMGMEDLKKQLALCNVVGRNEQLVCHRCNENEKQEVNDPCCIECKIEIEGQAN